MALQEQQYRVSLPEEVIYHVASCISDVGDLCTAAAVSRQWQRACSPHIPRHLREVVPRDPRELELRLKTTAEISRTAHPEDPDRWNDVNWRALGLSYALKDDRINRDWKDGNVTTRWVPHVFDRDNLSISAVCPREGYVLCNRDYTFSDVALDEAGATRKFNTFSFDSRLVPEPGTISGGFFPSRFPDGEHWGCADVPGMGPVLLFAPKDPNEAAHDDDGAPHNTENQMVEVWVTPADRERWTGLDSLDSTIQPSERANAPIPDNVGSPQEWVYLATIPFRIDLCETIPPLDRVLALHADYDRDGAHTLVAAHSYRGRAIVRRVAEASRMLDADGKPTLANAANLVTTFKHDLLGDTFSDWGDPLCYTYIDSDYVFAAQTAAVSVWSRATGEHVVTLDSALVHCGPLVDLGSPGLSGLSRDADKRVFKRQPESVPSNTTAVRQFSIECVLPDESGYPDLVERDVQAGQFEIGPDTLILAGGNLIFWTECRWMVLVDYASVFQRAMEIPKEEEPEFYQPPEDREPPVDRRLQEVVAPCLVEFALDCGDEDEGDEPPTLVRAFDHRLLYATEKTTYVLDLSTIPRLPATERFRIPVLEVIGVGRNLETGYYNQRFFMTNSSVYEVVTLSRRQELGSMDNGYLEATQGFPKTVRWRHDWSWPLEEEQYACAIRVLSVEPHEKFVGRPYKASHSGGWAAWQERNYVVDSKTGGILEHARGVESASGWGEAELRTKARHERLERRQQRRDAQQ
ncbi:hypothetical protein Q8F55_009306 [Vanrija albida]|uniref:F-box domain-containing protein n=1 Tax=Vanrija albida TaxID=181172 RepID=A0ABR3PU57_9TREE